MMTLLPPYKFIYSSIECAVIIPRVRMEHAAQELPGCRIRVAHPQPGYQGLQPYLERGLDRDDPAQHNCFLLLEHSIQPDDAEPPGSYYDLEREFPRQRGCGGFLGRAAQVRLAVDCTVAVQVRLGCPVQAEPGCILRLAHSRTELQDCGLRVEDRGSRPEASGRIYLEHPAADH